MKNLLLFITSLIFFLSFNSSVFGDEVYSRGAEFTWCNAYSGSCSITELRYDNSAKVTLVGPYNAVEYNKNNFEYLAGIRFWTWLDGNKNDVLSLYYTLNLSGLKEDEIYSNDWLNEKNSFYSSPNVTILNSKLISNNYVEDKSPTIIEGNPVYLGTQTIKFKVNVQLNNDLSNQSIYVGFGYYNPSSGLSSKLIYKHIASVVVLFADNYYSIDNSSTIINQFDKTNEELENVNDNLEDLNNNITDESPPNTDGLSGAAGWLPAGPVDSLINLPLAFFNSISRDLGSSCKPVNLPLPYVNKNLTLPCMSTFYDGIKINSFMDWVGLIASGFILFSYLLKLYKWVDDTLTFRENNHLDNWGGV